MADWKLARPDPAWTMRTYSGHSSARASNELYRTNLSKGQTGLSIAFDLPTQTGYDPDSPMAHGEVGKVGVPVAHLGHMRTLLDQIPVDKMNTSMTINATAPWLLGLYVANAREHGVDSAALRGTTQNDIVKEYLSRGTYIFPPAPSQRLIVDMIAWCATHSRSWNPMNVCSYHLQEAGATPVQEIAYALANAIAVLDAVRDSGQVTPDRFAAVVGSISFFVNAGIRFVEEICKLRAFTEMWDGICRDRYGVTDPKLLRFRYGAHRSTAGKQRAAHRVGDAGRHHVALGSGSLGATASVERSNGVAPTMGSTMVVAYATSAGVRERSAGVPRPVRRLDRGRGPHRRAHRAGQHRTTGRARHGRGVRSHRHLEGPVGSFTGRSNRSYRTR
jgi:methylmalonyl-CoA mutase cobalamin-binding domain/chain